MAISGIGLAIAKDMNTLNTILNKTGPLDISQLADTIENKFNPKTFSKILIKGILAGDEIGDITERVFKKLPRRLETADNRAEIEKLVIASIQHLLPQVDSKTAEGFLQVNPEMVAVTNISENGVAFIGNYEKPPPRGKNGLYLTYDDGYGNPTIGYGHLVKGSEVELFKNGITYDEVLKLKKQDIQKYVNIVKRSVKVPLTQQQFDALVSLAFNFGSVPNVVASKLHQGNYEGAVESFNLIIWATNKKTGNKGISNGLINRRKDEVEIFKNGDYIRNH